MEHPHSGGIGKIRVPRPLLEHVLRHVRSLENGLSLVGAFNIETDEWDMEWVPETEEERCDLRTTSFGSRMDTSHPRDMPFVPEDLVSRCVSNTAALESVDSVLCFNRYGREHMSAGRYIHAFREFFFVIESRFGGGKFHKAALIQELSSHAEFKAVLLGARAEPAEWDDGSPRCGPYRATDAAGLIKHLVQVRAVLHHHNSVRKGIWKPSEQDAYRPDARFVGAVAHKLCKRLLTDALTIN